MQRPPVLVLGSGLTALGAIRLLHSAGYAPFVIGDDGGMASRSRWFRAAPKPASGACAVDDLAAYLHALPFSSRAPLVPCSDAWVRRVAAIVDTIDDRFPSSVPAPGVLERLIDKWQLAELLRALELPHPPTFALECGTDVSTIPESVIARAFLKPRDSGRFFQQFGVKAFHVRSRGEIATRLAEILPTGLGIQLQEYVPGPPENHYYVEGFIDRAGRLHGPFLRRRLRMYPVDFGNSTYFESAPPTAVPDAVETIKRLLASVSFHGLFSAEFKLDQRDGICRLLDVNVRPWWYVEFAGQCGLNFCDMLVRDALGQQQRTARPYRVGFRCVYPYYDFAACKTQRGTGSLAIRRWAGSWVTSTQPVFRWTDPMPAVGGVARMLARRFARFFRGHQSKARALTGVV